MAADNIFWKDFFKKASELWYEPRKPARRAIITTQFVQEPAPQALPEHRPKPSTKLERRSKPLHGTTTAVLVDLTPSTTGPSRPIPIQLPEAAMETSTQSHRSNSAELYAQATNAAYTTNYHDESNPLLTSPPPGRLHEPLMAYNPTAFLPHTFIASTPFPLDQPLLQSAVPSFSDIITGNSSGFCGATSSANIQASNLTRNLSPPIGDVYGYGPRQSALIAMIVLIKALFLLRIISIFFGTARAVNREFQESQQVPAADDEQVSAIEVEQVSTTKDEQVLATDHRLVSAIEKQVSAIEAEQVTIIEAEQVSAIDDEEADSTLILYAGKNQDTINAGDDISSSLTLGKGGEQDVDSAGGYTVSTDPSLWDFRDKITTALATLLQRYRKVEEDLFLTAQRLMDRIDNSDSLETIENHYDRCWSFYLRSATSY